MVAVRRVALVIKFKKPFFKSVSKYYLVRGAEEIFVKSRLLSVRIKFSDLVADIAVVKFEKYSRNSISCSVLDKVGGFPGGRYIEKKTKRYDKLKYLNSQALIAKVITFNDYY